MLLFTHQLSVTGKNVKYAECPRVKIFLLVCNVSRQHSDLCRGSCPQHLQPCSYNTFKGAGAQMIWKYEMQLLH